MVVVVTKSISTLNQVTHGIKLHPPRTSTSNAISNDTQVPVVSEIYDEVVFTDPNESFFQQLIEVRKVPSIESEYSHHEHFTQFSDTDDVHALLEAQKFLQQQLLEAKQRLKAVDDALEQVDGELEAVHDEQQSQRGSSTSAAAASTYSRTGNSATKAANNKPKAPPAMAASSSMGDGSSHKGSPTKKMKQK
jgi:hypothetical protein